MEFESSHILIVQSIIDAIPNPVFLKDRRHNFVFVNSSACDFFGYSRETLLATPDARLFPLAQVLSFRAVDNTVFETHSDSESEEEVTDATGSIRSVITRKRLTRLNGKDYLMAVVTDVTAYRQAEARNRYLAFHDTLTGLPNRALLAERIDQALLRRTGRCALLYIDLDRFREVNDTYGHDPSDELIRVFADRLTGIACASDTVARLGGDEFAILLADTADDPTAADVCSRILKAASQAFEIDGKQVVVSASIGVAFAGREAIEHGELQRRADLALYRAKCEGRGCYRIFSKGLDEIICQRRRVEVELREMLSSRGGLEVHYQPLVGIKSGSVECFEALARWRHPTRGLVMPDEFIPIAEASGLIVELGERVLAKACSDAMEWDPRLNVSVNVSPAQFASGDFADMVDRVLRHSGLCPSRLELEITEGILIVDAQRSLSIFKEIRARGVRVALDDFGTGYSSLSYFQHFPFDKVKIDRAFVADMIGNPHAHSIVEAVISLGRGLGLQVVAEGVETAEQLALLEKLNCSQAQGYLIGRPNPIDFFIGSTPVKKFQNKYFETRAA